MAAAASRKVTIVSAHEGALTWVRMCRFIAETTGYEIVSFHEYDDERYRSARSTWQRALLRVRTFLIFPLRFLLHFRRLTQTSDLLLVVTSPFFMPILASMAALRDTGRTVTLLNDIYPEALVAKRWLRRDGVVERIIKRVFAKSFMRLGHVVFISEQHRALISRDTPISHKSSVIPVSAYSDPFVNDVPTTSTGAIDVLYCGTLGHMHDTRTFLDWLARGGSRAAVRFSFYTSGASKARFEKDLHALMQRNAARVDVRIGNALPEQGWVEVMRGAQVGLVFQDVGAGSVVFPSKIASILAAGQAVLAVAEASSEIARLVVSHDCGWVIEPNDPDGFDGCIEDMLRSEVLLRKRTNAFELGQSVFGKAAVASKWVELFDRIAIDMRASLPR
jgi:colanic acid biosynthesis glycosyl transferase WcaI